MKHAIKIAAALSLAYVSPTYAASNAAPWGLDSVPSPHPLTLYSDGAWNVFASVLGSGGNQNITWPGLQTLNQYPVFTALTAVNGLDLTPTTFSGCAFKSPGGFCVTQAGVPQSPAFPGLSLNVGGTTNMPGLDMQGCTSTVTCGWMLYSSAAYPAAATTTLRVQKSFPSAGGGTHGNVYNGLWTFGSTGENDAGYVWLNQTQLYNWTKASTAAQNVANASTIIKALGTNAPGTAIGYSAAVYGECSDSTGAINPTAPCLGAEFDTYANVGAGTDTARQRVALQVNGGVVGGPDPSVHIGALILMGSNNSPTIDSGITTGAGLTVTNFIDTSAATISGKLIKATNFEVDGSGNATIYGQVAIGNTTSLALTVAGQENLAKGLLHTPVTIAALPACNAGIRGMLRVVTDGTQYGVGGYGTPVGAANTVVRQVMCSDTAGIGVYAWYYN